MKLSDIILLLKGKRAAVGEIRNWKGGNYIKTATGWKPHEKQYSKKFVERKNNAAGKKESDLKHRQSEVARLSGEIQGHKAAVEHHTAQNTKQDERQAKHHAIRAQVKQRRLDKHKEILEQRHGVKDEVVKPVKKKQFNFSKPLSLNSIQNNTWGKQPENLSNDDLLKTYAYVQYANYAIKRNLLNPPTGKTHILPQVGGQDNINAFENEIKKRGLENAFEIDIDLSQYRVKSPEAKANFEKWKAERQEEKPTTPQEQPKPKEIDTVELRKDDKGNPRKPFQMNKEEFRAMYRPEVSKTKKGYDVIISQYRSENIYAHPLGSYQNKYHIDKSTAENLLSNSGVENEKVPYMKKQKEKQILTDYIHKEFFVKNSKHKIVDSVNKGEISKDKAIEILLNAGVSKDEMPDGLIETPKPKDVIQSGSRGATIAGQQYSKREVDILNSLDDIINRAKSPVVQDLLKKRQAATIELPSKELGQPKLEAHESKFMELVKRNRSQADKQAGYPEERRKVEAETGVKIPREKAVEMTKHMKASFIWDIKKPLLIK
jgi:hypothetical protein